MPTGIPGLGWDTRLQIGREAIWGTAPSPAATERLLVSSLDNQSKVEEIEPSVLSGGIIESIAPYLGAHRARATFEGEINTLKMLLLLDTIMGTSTFGSAGGVKSGGGSPYTYTFDMLRLLNSLTLQMIPANIPTGKCESIVGAKVAEATLTFAVRQACKWKATFVGKTLTTNATPTSLSDPTPVPFLFLHGTTNDDGTADTGIVMTEAELTIRNGLLETRDSLSSGYILEPIRGRRAEVEFKFKSEFQTKTLLDAFLARTDGSPQIVLANGSSTFTVSMPHGYIKAYGRPISKPEAIEQDFTWRAIDAGGVVPAGQPQIVVVSADSSMP